MLCAPRSAPRFDLSCPVMTSDLEHVSHVIASIYLHAEQHAVHLRGFALLLL